VDLGVQRAFFPESVGELGLRSSVTMCMVWEEIARGDVGLTTHLSMVR